MEFRDSADILVRDCRFLLNISQLRTLIPNIEGYLPPFTAIRFSDHEVPRFVWGFPVIHGTRLLGTLHRFLFREIQRFLENPAYQEDLRNLTATELREDAYFRVVSDFLLRTLAEGSFLRLDSLLWIYLADSIARILNQDEMIERALFDQNINELGQIESNNIAFSRLRFRDARRFTDIRIKLLKSLFARHDFSNSSMKDVFDEVPNNPVQRELMANRIIFTERAESFYRTLDVSDIFLIKAYKFTASDFMGLNRLLRAAITAMLERTDAGKPVGMDSYFLKTFVGDDARQKIPSVPIPLLGTLERVGQLRDTSDSDDRERLALILSLQPEPVSYLFNHICNNAKEYLKGIERIHSIPREIVNAIRHHGSALIFEGLYNDVVRDLLRWEFLNALRSRLRFVVRKQDGYSFADRPLAKATIPVDFDSYYEVYRRSRYGTAVFFDLVGFTNRTKALTRELLAAAERGDKESPDLSVISLSIQRIFSVRNSVEQFGGIPQGFEGDAILDVFPKALDALRYVTLFVNNYSKNRTIRFKPFDRPRDNPYHEGFRVGLATGDYSVIHIVNRSRDLGEETTQERAVGHTINRASRLNSGKKGDKLFLSAEELLRESEVSDPLGMYRVRINSRGELQNDGIASFEDTFAEICDEVKAENLSWYEPDTLRGFSIHGVRPVFQLYEFELIFEEPKLQRIFLIRRLKRAPELKGLEDETNVVYEYLILELVEFLDFLRRDAEHAALTSRRNDTGETVLPLDSGLRLALAAGAGSLETSRPSLGETSPEPPRPSPYQWFDLVDQENSAWSLGAGIGASEIESGPDQITMAILRHARQSSRDFPPPPVLELDLTSGTGFPEPRIEPSLRPTREAPPSTDGPSRPPWEISAESAKVRVHRVMPESEDNDVSITVEDEITGDLTSSFAAHDLGSASFLADASADTSLLGFSGESLEQDDGQSDEAVAKFVSLGEFDAEWGGLDLPEEPLTMESPALLSTRLLELDWLDQVSLEERSDIAGDDDLGGCTADLLEADASGGAVVARCGHVDDQLLEQVDIYLQKYAFAVIDASEFGAERTSRVIIGKLEADTLKDVHVYTSMQATGLPWTLDAVFSRFLSDKIQGGFEVQPATWMVAGTISDNLQPLALAHLKRLVGELGWH